MVLQAIRDRAQNWIAWVIIGLLILVFAFWGINAYFEPESDITVAKVNGVKITQSTYQRVYEQQRQQLASRLGSNVSDDFLEAMGLKRQVLDRLVEEEAQVQVSRDLGYRIGIQQLVGHINQIQAFQKEGRFDRELYEQVLSSNALRPVAWEQEQLRALLLTQPFRGVTSTQFAVKPELDAVLRLREQQRSVGYGVLALAKFEEGVSISDEEVKAFYDKNQDRYKTNEEVKVDYIELNINDLAKTVPIDDAALRERYEEQKSSFGIEERRKASHILFQLPPDADEDKIAQVRKNAEDILARVRKGEAFDVLAKANSDDPGSASQGGDLGFFGRGIMEKAFEEAAFLLSENQISDLVRTGFGFHIIKLTAIEAGKVKPFEEVRTQLANDYQMSQAEDQFFQQLDKLETLSFEHPDTLAPAAQAIGVPVQTSAWFARNTGEGVAGNTKVRDAVFAGEVLAGKVNSGVIELATNHVVVVHVRERKPPLQQPLEEVKVSIASTLKRERAGIQVAEQGKVLLEKIKAGEDPVALGSTMNAEWKRPGPIKREESTLAPNLVRDIFAASTPVDNKPIIGSVTLANGDVVVYAVYEVKEGDLAQVKEEDRKVLRDQSERLAGQAMYQALVGAWKKEVDSALYPDKI